MEFDEEHGLQRSRKIRVFKDEFVTSNVQNARETNGCGENQARTGRRAHRGRGSLHDQTVVVAA